MTLDWIRVGATTAKHPAEPPSRKGKEKIQKNRIKHEKTTLLSGSTNPLDKRTQE